MIGILIFTVLVISLTVPSVGAVTIDGSGFGGIKINGRGEAVYGIRRADVTATFALGVRGQNEAAIWGTGIGQISLQGFISTGRGPEHLMTVRWTYVRSSRSIAIIGEAGDSDVLSLSGTVVGNLGRAPRATVELSGTLSWQTEIVSLELVASTNSNH